MDYTIDSPEMWDATRDTGAFAYNISFDDVARLLARYEGKPVSIEVDAAGSMLALTVVSVTGTLHTVPMDTDWPDEYKVGIMAMAMDELEFELRHKRKKVGAMRFERHQFENARLRGDCSADPPVLHVTVGIMCLSNQTQKLELDIWLDPFRPVPTN
jgi:hypothetical protein